MRISSAHRIALAMAIATALLVLWMQGAVATEDDSPGLLFCGVLGVGIIGALLARFRPLGMARALLATALAQALVAAAAMVAWQQYVELLILNGSLCALWIGSSLLFRRAARAGRASATA